MSEQNNIEFNLEGSAEPLNTTMRNEIIDELLGDQEYEEVEPVENESIPVLEPWQYVEETEQYASLRRLYNQRIERMQEEALIKNIFWFCAGNVTVIAVLLFLYTIYLMMSRGLG